MRHRWRTRHLITHAVTRAQGACGGSFGF